MRDEFTKSLLSRGELSVFSEDAAMTAMEEKYPANGDTKHRQDIRKNWKVEKRRSRTEMETETSIADARMHAESTTGTEIPTESEA